MIDVQNEKTVYLVDILGMIITKNLRVLREIDH